MLGLFQADLPIGKRLWSVLLVLVISGALSNGAISLSQDPLKFVIQVLLFFGHITVLSILFAIPLGMVGTVIEKTIMVRRIKQKTFESRIQPDISDNWLLMVLNITFVVAILIAIPEYGSSFASYLGIIGLTIFLAIELFDFNIMFKETIEILEIKSNQNGKVKARLVYNEGDESYSVAGGFLHVIRKVEDSNWRLVNIAILSDSSTAIFERSIKRSRLERRIAQKVPSKIQKTKK